MSDKWKVLVVMLFAVVAAAIGEALAAKGMKATHQEQAGVLEQIRAALGDWHVLAGTLLMIGYVGLYVYTLGLTDLSFALPLSASSYLLGALLSKFYLHEDIKLARVIGTTIIIVGVIVVGVGGSGGDSNKDKDKGKPSSPSQDPEIRSETCGSGIPPVAE